MGREMKHTEIGDIPADWEVQTFEETFRILTNNTLSRADLNDREGIIRNIHYGDILTRYSEVLDCDNVNLPFLNSSSLLTATAVPLQDGDVILADTAEDETVGKATEVYRLGEKKMVAGLHTIPCRVKKGSFAPRWLGYYMNSHAYHDQVLPYITGIKVSSISKSAIAETIILIPPVPEQEKIVAVLSEIDALIANLEKLVEKYEAIKQGCLECMFPRSGQTVPERRLPGFTGDWEDRKLEEMYRKIRNAFVGTASPYYVEDGHFYLESNNVKNGQINRNAEVFINDKFYESQKDNWLHTGDIVMVQSGHVGHTAVIPEDLDNTAAHALIIIANPVEEINPYFVNYQFQAPKSKDAIENITTGNTIKHVLASEIKKFEIQVPIYEEQKQIGAFFCNLDHHITLNQRKAEKYKMIKQGIMSELLTGKIRLI